MKVLFVCLGNICRSPLAAGLLKQQAIEKGFDWQIDSAGLANKYIGNPADPRILKVAENHAIDLSNHIARKFDINDFDKFDMIVTMDDKLYQKLSEKALTLIQRDKIWVLADFLLEVGDNVDIPDPYFWEENLFESLFIKIETACKLLIETYSPCEMQQLLAPTLIPFKFAKRA